MVYALNLASQKEDEPKEYLEENLNNYLYKLWEIYCNGKKSGVVVALCVDGMYTLDGYNNTKNFFMAVEAGKKASDEIFKVTNEIWTIHKQSLKMVTLLALRIGFTLDKYEDGYIYLIRRKNGNRQISQKSTASSD